MKPKMKFFAGLLLALIIANQTTAQKAQVTNAHYYLTNTKDFAKAQKAIDEASTHKKTSADAKTHYLRGMIYESIANANDPVGGDSAVLVAFQSYDKAVKLGKPGQQYHDESKRRIDALWGSALNKGVEYYNEEDLENAMKYYQLAAKIRPKDTLAIIYTATAADKMGDFVTFEKVLNQLKSINYNNLEYYYKRLLQVYTKEDGEHFNTNKALAIVNEARVKYPEDKDYLLLELGIYQELGKVDVLEQKLKDAIAQDPNNEMLLLALAQIYDEQYQNAEDAEEKERLKKLTMEQYAKVSNANPNNFDAPFNMGVIIYNEAVEFVKQIEKLSLKEYNTKGAKLEAKAKDKWKQSLGHFDKAYQINPKNRNLLKAMQNCHIRLNNADKAAKYQKEMMGIE